MTSKTKKGKVCLKFYHILPQEGDITPPIKRRAEHPQGTYCEIRKDYYKGRIISVGRSTLHPIDWDKFNKEVGRKIALSEALKSSGLDKEDRGVVWESYLNR